MICDATIGSVPKVVEKGIGISYPIGKPTNRKGGYTDEERIPQGTGLFVIFILKDLFQRHTKCFGDPEG